MEKKNYSTTKLSRPLEILTASGIRLVGVSEIAVGHHGITYLIGEIKHIEKETNYTIINVL